MSSSGGKIPRDAVPAGVARSRWLSEETLYVGRVYHSGHLRIGKVSYETLTLMEWLCM